MTRTAYPENSVDPDGEFPMGDKEYFFYLLFQAARQRDLAVEERLEDLGLNLPGWRALAVMRRIDDCTMKALARYSTIDRTTLTRTVDQLVDHGHVERCVPARDRRQVNLSLSGGGSETYDQAIARVMALNHEVLASIDPQELRIANRVIQVVLCNIVADEALAADLVSFGRTAPVAAKTAGAASEPA